MKNCACTFINGGWVNKECKYHETHCHAPLCKNKSLKGKEYCKKHQKYWDEISGDPEGFGGRESIPIDVAQKRIDKFRKKHSEAFEPFDTMMKKAYPEGLEEPKKEEAIKVPVNEVSDSWVRSFAESVTKNIKSQVMKQKFFAVGNGKKETN
jgi:hypothetical protein